MTIEYIQRMHSQGTSGRGTGEHCAMCVCLLQGTLGRGTGEHCAVCVLQGTLGRGTGEHCAVCVCVMAHQE